ncbi:hypothetical protein [Aulosira sp. FACHB-615]|uniref:hypothetical protein n=1 Tax=Aulosira sp. FACHB-615 TaxID=2692777 RepID=UPI001684C66A|nr:hypothetical protein [Aulosira sp. FACHB-615]
MVRSLIQRIFIQNWYDFEGIVIIAELGAIAYFTVGNSCRLGGGTEPNTIKTLLGYAIATPNLLFS